MFRLKHYIRPYVFFIIATLFIKFLGAAAELLIPYLMEILLDEIVPARDISGVLRYGIIMLLDAQMLILDEATSNVDTRTEEHIQAAMRELMKGKTCFVIAHRLSTIRSADQILVLDGGSIAEQGNHDTLMAKNGIYRRLYESQFDALS